MAPRKHKIGDEDEFTSATPSPRGKTEKAKAVKPRAEKRVKLEKPKKEKGDADKDKVEKPKKEKSDFTKAEAVLKLGKDVKEKVVTVAGEEAMELILMYLEKQNRPYSATEVSSNLHGKVSKTVADKLLKDMAESGKIKYKATKGNDKGSQFVFWALQSEADHATPEELAVMDDTIKSLKDAIPSLKNELKVAISRLKTLKSSPTSVELMDRIERLREDNYFKKQRLETYNSGGARTVTKEDVASVEKEFRYWNNKRESRKRAFLSLEDPLLEMMPRDELWEKAGFEDVPY